MRRSGRVYSVDPGRPFVVALAEAVLAGELPAPGSPRPDALGLADILLYLPTRRPAQALQQAFIAAGGGAALLLPRIKVIASDSEELELLAAAESFLGDAAEIPRAIGELERQLLLARLVQTWARQQQRASLEPFLPDEAYSASGARGPSQAIRLARELARLIDALETGGIDFARLVSLVDAEHTEQWQRTLDFLNIALGFWPAYLAENGLLSPVAHRRSMLERDAHRLREARPAAPVIVAGLTSADAATVGLIEAVLALPEGALVLPALDRTLDEDSWAAIAKHPEHPQHGLQRLLADIGLRRQDVRLLGGTPAASVRAPRWTLACETMRPAGTTEVWHRFAAAADKAGMQAALRGVSLVEADSAQEEAEAIALILREALERPRETAMLVTPDRALARRVAARLAAWGLDIEDLGGEPFAKTFVGTFLELVVAAAQEAFAPVPLMTLLKHPLCRLRMRSDEMDAGRRALELICFRAPYFGSGLEGLQAALESEAAQARRPRAARRLGNAEWRAARELVRRLGLAFAPLVQALCADPDRDLAALVDVHYRTAQELAATSAEDDGSALRQGDAGEWAARLFASLLDPGLLESGLTGWGPGGAGYPDLYRALVADKRIRPRRSGHPRIAICDPYEARLQQPDLVILGSLNEASWPRAADPGPWLSRPMRQELGLPAPEERIGEAAHDLAAQLGAPRVVLTRAAKVDGAPTVPSRWLLRLQALVKGMGLSLAPEQPWLAWARARNTVVSRRRLGAPEPRPPLAVRPRQLSVTEIERWIANPYAIFARHILELEKLEPLGVRPGAALRGQIVHSALGRLTQRFPIELPQDLAGELADIVRQVLGDYTSNPRIAAFWARRIARFARWFAETEAARRAGTTEVVAEIPGRIVLDGPAGPFTLTARADRIDVHEDGVVITDYKSGQSLDGLVGRAADGSAPQLPLEAAIAVAGGFDSVPAARVSALRYISTAGGEPPGQEFPVKGSAGELAVAARGGLARLIAEFDREDTPYRALRRARFRYDYDDYAHLARVEEWSVDEGEED